MQHSIPQTHNIGIMIFRQMNQNVVENPFNLKSHTCRYLYSTTFIISKQTLSENEKKRSSTTEPDMKLNLPDDCTILAV